MRKPTPEDPVKVEIVFSDNTTEIREIPRRLVDRRGELLMLAKDGVHKSGVVFKVIEPKEKK